MSRAAATAEAIAPELAARLSELVTERMGLFFPPSRRGDLLAGIAFLAEELGYDDPAAFAERIVSTPWTRKRTELLAERLTVGETYFFRHGGDIEVLEKRIVPALVRERRDRGRIMRFWSAGCCTGEEAYTIAMVLDGAVPDIDDWRITILATDINPRFLSRAEEGIFGRWSFRSTPPALRERYFREEGAGRFRIAERIRRMVRFRHLNLAEGAGYPSPETGTTAMDVIFCRNVLIYFDHDLSRRVLERFSRCLAESGWLFVGPSEAPLVSTPFFDRLSFEGSLPFRKRGGSSPAPLLPPIPGEAPARPAAAPAPWRESGKAPRGRSGSPPAGDGSGKEPAPGLLPDGPSCARREGAGKGGMEDPLRPAMEFYRRGRYEEAAALLEDLCDGPRASGGGATAAMALLVRVLTNQGRLEEALGWCARARAAEKMNPEFHYLEAAVLLELDRFEESEKALRRVLYLDPGFALAHFTLGILSRRRGRDGEAERHFENALSLVRSRPGEEILPASEGITAERLRSLIEAMRA